MIEEIGTVALHALSRIDRIVVTKAGDALPVTNWYDEDGDECEPGDAVAAVAGPQQDGSWISFDLEGFTGKLDS